MIYVLTEVQVKQVARETRKYGPLYHVVGKADGVNVVLAAKFGDIEVAQAYSLKTSF